MSLAWKTGLITALACVALIGCGGDDSDESASGAGGSGGASGTNGGSSGTSGEGGASGTSGEGGASGTSSGGTGGIAGGFELPMCSEDLPTTPLTCGTTECPMPMTVMGFDTCQRPCCAGDVCGTKTAVEGMATSECRVPAQPDPRCPNVPFMDMDLVGCCIDNKCGIISALRGNSCVTESMIVDLPAVPQACDAAGGEDAGAP